MSLKYGILGLLNYNESTGYDLSKLFEYSLRLFYHAQQSQVYKELTQLEKEGCVMSRTILQTEKPNKKVYSITDKGRDSLLDWLSEFDEEQHFRKKLPLIMKVFFAASISDDEMIKTFTRVKELAEQKILKLKDDFKDLASQNLKSQKEDRNSLYWSMTLEYGLMNYRMCSQWADRCISMIKKQQPS